MRQGASSDGPTGTGAALLAMCHNPACLWCCGWGMPPPISLCLCLLVTQENLPEKSVKRFNDVKGCDEAIAELQVGGQNGRMGGRVMAGHPAAAVKAEAGRMG